MKHVEYGVKAYEAPALETLDINVEQGFATTGILGDEGNAGDILYDENEYVY